MKPIDQILLRFSSERLFNEDIELDDEWFFWQMDNKIIIYKYDKVRLDELKYNMNNHFFRFIEGAPYKYITKGDVAAYEKYCKFHEASGLPLMTKERFDKLIESVNKNGYNENKIIIVDNKNTLLDGQHRACILASKYGEESYIRVLKIWDIKKILRRILIRR